ncbi:hypothetical protein ACFL27_12910 [candidate division CSSED10-310 bacterium]|uniref:Uncharacterized protein n=1 Tax=candidate division CSSED10-310 bacterium TaxID=2855610 RepID=A0ABV6YY26_UNCC1
MNMTNSDDGIMALGNNWFCQLQECLLSLIIYNLNSFDLGKIVKKIERVNHLLEKLLFGGWIMVNTNLIRAGIVILKKKRILGRPAS